jgi:hypothetical protein
MVSYYDNNRSRYFILHNNQTKEKKTNKQKDNKWD